MRNKYCEFHAVKQSKALEQGHPLPFWLIATGAPVPCVSYAYSTASSSIALMCWTAVSSPAAASQPLRRARPLKPDFVHRDFGAQENTEDIFAITIAPTLVAEHSAEHGSN